MCSRAVLVGDFSFAFEIDGCWWAGEFSMAIEIGGCWRADGRGDVISGVSRAILRRWEIDWVTRLFSVVVRFRCCIVVVCG